MKINHKFFLLLVIAAVFGTAVLFNAFQKDRPTVSESENRELASFPKPTAESLFDGTFFAGIDAFVSDTFLGREALVSVSNKITYLHSLSAVIPDDEEDIVFIPTSTVKDDPLPSKETEEPESFEPEPIKEPETVEEEDTQEPVETVEITEPELVETIEPEEPADEPETQEPVETTEDTEPELVEIIETEEPVETVAEEPEKTDNTPEPAPAETVAVEVGTDGGEAEFTSDGYIIYKNAIYSIPYMVPSVAEAYGKAIDRYAELFSGAKVSILCAPLSSAMIDNEKIKKKVTDQNKMINSINAYCSDAVNKVNVYSTLYEHRNEYLFFRSDHHWTARGAYYAYAEFARSVGLEPTPIENMEERLLNKSWHGSMYKMSGDERVKEFSDELYAYLPTKACKMTVYSSDGSSYTKNSCIHTSYTTYTAFIDGDNPYTVINVPENPSDRRILVLKDSYGDAFVPFLTENYGVIIVADPRYVTFNIYELLKDYKLTDVLFMTNLYNPNVKSWLRNVKRIIGE